jgi:hypothetical protein
MTAPAGRVTREELEEMEGFWLSAPAVRQKDYALRTIATLRAAWDALARIERCLEFTEEHDNCAAIARESMPPDLGK